MLSVSGAYATASNNIIVTFAGGTNNSFGNVIEQVTIASTGNSTDFGDLTQSTVYYCAGTGNKHGGLQ